MKMKLLVFLVAIFLTANLIYSRPQYSILQNFGAKCINCHVNNQGGGVRTNQGFVSRNNISLINPQTIGLGGLFDNFNTNSFFDDKLLFGFDFRYQSARWPTPNKTVERQYMIMQTSPYIVFKPFDWLWFEGFYNFSFDIESKSKRYPGQQVGAFSVNFKPSDELPSVRIGSFQPPIGTKYDDHTILLRRVGSDGKPLPLVPDDYAELGIQLDYDAIDWLGLSAGVFKDEHMAGLTKISQRVSRNPVDSFNTVYLLDSGKMSLAGRVGFYPKLPGGLNGYAGGTIFINGDYYISSLFCNIGLADKFAIMTEYMRSQKKDSRLTMNFLVELNYQPIDPVIFYVRGEREITRNINENQNIYVNELIFGSKIFVLPFIAFLPEYRILDRESIEGYSAQWTLQLHVFY